MNIPVNIPQEIHQDSVDLQNAGCIFLFSEIQDNYTSNSCIGIIITLELLHNNYIYCAYHKNTEISLDYQPYK